MRYTEPERLAIEAIMAHGAVENVGPRMPMADLAHAIRRHPSTVTSRVQALHLAGAIKWTPYQGVVVTPQGIAWLDDKSETVNLVGGLGKEDAWSIIQLSRTLRGRPQTGPTTAAAIAADLGAKRCGSGVQKVCWSLELADGNLIVIKPLTRCYMGQGEHFGNRLPRGIGDVPGCRLPFMIICGTWVIQEYVNILGKMSPGLLHTRLETLRAKVEDMFIGYDLHDMNCGEVDGLLVFIDA